MSNVTMKDIARKAGVTQPLVSYILNDTPNVKVNADTRARVLKISRELNYQTNQYAKSLKTGRTFMVGVSTFFSQARVSPLRYMFRRSYVSDLYAGIGDKLGDHEYKMVFHRVNDQDLELERSKLVDGIIYIVVSQYIDEFLRNQLPELQKLGLPFVIIHSLRENFNCHSIGLDCVQGARKAALHLIEHGYNRIGLVCRKDDVAMNKDLQQGFEEGMKKAGKQPEYYHVNKLYASDGQKIANKLLQNSKQMPQAFFTVSDELAQGMMKKFRAAGVQVPGDVALISFGNDINELNEFCELTSLAQPAMVKGQKAAGLLLNLLDDPEKLKKPQSTILEPELIIRKSCGC